MNQFELLDILKKYKDKKFDTQEFKVLLSEKHNYDTNLINLTKKLRRLFRDGHINREVPSFCTRKGSNKYWYGDDKD